VNQIAGKCCQRFSEGDVTDGWKQISLSQCSSSVVSPMSDFITLYCLVRGDPAEYAFHVDIPRNSRVSHLKEAVKEKNQPHFDNVPAKNLTLWRTNVPGGSTQYRQASQLTIPLDQITSFEFPEYQWTVMLPSTEPELIPVETVVREVKLLLAKLTLEKFDTISDQIIKFANQSVKETDGTTLQVVVQLTFEKAIDDPNATAVYAQLARKMLDKVSSDIKDDKVKNSMGKVITGGNLFRRYLLNHCQEGFERGWKNDLPKVDKNENGTVAAGLDPLFIKEYYSVKRRGLGLIEFIGELFKQQILTEGVMHECVQKLLSDVADPEEEDVESLCKLMTTVGKDLDHEKAKNWMDVYFDRMDDLLKHPKLPSRIKFMIQDVIDSRNSRWVNNTPKTMQETRDDLPYRFQRRRNPIPRTLKPTSRTQDLKAKQCEKENIEWTTNSGRPNLQQPVRGSSHSGGVNVPPVGSRDGWNAVPSTSSRKTGDLTQFGKMDRTKNTRVSTGPANGDVFANLRASEPFAMPAEDKKYEKSVLMLSTVSPIGTANMSSLRTAVSEWRPGIEEEEKANEEPRIKLLPRTLPILGSENHPILGTVPANETPVQKMSESEAKKKIDDMLKEFWSVVDVEGLVLCIKNFPSEYHSLIITEILFTTISKKKNEVKMMAKAFRMLADEKSVSKDSFETSFDSFVGFIDDISTNVPTVFEHIRILLTGARMYIPVFLGAHSS
ncbi:armadillo-type protein, partial [Jimgerdemannia flammicorona]